MITAAEYRAWADESLKWAHEAATESEREACTKSAEVWLQSVLRSERRSKGPNITTEHVWQLPPFQKWRRKGTPTQIAHGNGPVRNIIDGAIGADWLRRGANYAHERSAEIAGGVVNRGIGNAIAAAQPMTAEQAATLKRLAQAAYELEAFQPNLTLAEADLRIVMLTAKLKLLDEPPHTL
jgi:hypothetical protein